MFELLLILLIPVLIWLLVKFFLALVIGSAVIAIIFASPNLYAQTVSDPAHANMQRAVGGIVNKHVATQGYAQADPKIYQTLKGIGTAAVGGVAAGGAAILVAGTSVAWGTVLAVAVAGSVVSYAVSLGLNGLVNWLFPTTSPTTVTATATAPANTYTLPNGTPCANAQNVNDNCVTAGQPSVNLGTLCLPTTGPMAGQNPTNSCLASWKTNNPTAPQNITTQAAAMAYAGFSVATSAVTSTVNTTPNVSMTSLSAAQKDTPVDYNAMALMTNYLWKQASLVSGYQGVPYDASNPITATEVQAYAAANPSAYPSVAALVAPIGAVGSAAVTTGLAPSTTSDPTVPVVPATPTTPPGTTVIAPPSATTDLGVDPNIRFTPPVAPTAQSILDPILNMLPGWRSATFTANGTCPKPVINLSPFMNLTVTMDSYCNLLEANRSLISSMMSGVWLLIAALIVLGA